MDIYFRKRNIRYLFILYPNSHRWVWQITNWSSNFAPYLEVWKEQNILVSWLYVLLDERVIQNPKYLGRLGILPSFLETQQCGCGLLPFQQQKGHSQLKVAEESVLIPFFPFLFGTCIPTYLFLHNYGSKFGIYHGGNVSFKVPRYFLQYIMMPNIF